MEVNSCPGGDGQRPVGATRVTATGAKNRFGSLCAEAAFGDWISAQTARFKAHGIPGADLRPL